MTGTRDFGGLVLFQGLPSLPGLLTRLRQNGRSCNLAPMDVTLNLETGFPIFILFCNSSPNLFRLSAVALES